MQEVLTSPHLCQHLLFSGVLFLFLFLIVAIVVGVHLQHFVPVSVKSRFPVAVEGTTTGPTGQARNLDTPWTPCLLQPQLAPAQAMLVPRDCASRVALQCLFPPVGHLLLLFSPLPPTFLLQPGSGSHGAELPVSQLSTISASQHCEEGPGALVVSAVWEHFF